MLAGASGVAPIQGFDTTGYPVTFAAEVKNFDPLNFVDKKEARKMGRFIHFAFAATHEAIKQSGLEITPEVGDRTGVLIGSGIGGFGIVCYIVGFGNKGGKGLVVMNAADGVQAAGGAGLDGIFGSNGGGAGEEVCGEAFDE